MRLVLVAAMLLFAGTALAAGSGDSDLLKQAGRREEARTTFHLALSIAPNDHDGWTPTRILGELDDLE